MYSSQIRRPYEYLLADRFAKTKAMQRRQSGFPSFGWQRILHHGTEGPIYLVPDVIGHIGCTLYTVYGTILPWTCILLPY
jgi:hypothetical protein